MTTSSMTPEQKIKHAILVQAVTWTDVVLSSITAENINGLFDSAKDGDEDRDQMQDAENGFREGEVETSLPCEWSRHYESKSVAAKMPDGSWVGWTYWYGGGKHGEPEAIDWMDDAYDLTVVEETKTVVVQTFSRAAVPA